MRILGRSLLAGAGILATAFISLSPAAAQYYGRGAYPDRDYQRYERHQRGNLEAQKRAIRAQREAQRRGARYGGYAGAYPGRDVYRGGGYYYGGSRGLPGGNAATGGNGGPGGFVMQPGPYGSYAVPIQPGNNNGNN